MGEEKMQHLDWEPISTSIRKNPKIIVSQNKEKEKKYDSHDPNNNKSHRSNSSTNLGHTISKFRVTTQTSLNQIRESFPPMKK